jgi:hypothetical protein
LSLLQAVCTGNNVINIIINIRVSNFNTDSRSLFHSIKHFSLQADKNCLKMILERNAVGQKSWTYHILQLMARLQISIAQGEA